MVELKINIGDEYKIKIEKGKDFKGSIFNDIYEKAALNVDEIINQAEIKRKKIEKIKTSYISDFSISDDYNNIITFTGERGSGKSSSMVSFGEALVNKNNSIIVDDFFKDYTNINKKEFLSIEMIDPSLFGTKDTLLEIIISKMFLKFQKDLDKSNNSDLDYDKKRILIVLFQKVFENLKTLHNEKKIIYEQEAIEALSKLANSTNLKENFKLLIDHYLDYFKKSEGFLLIAIDDFDLNIQGAYSMLEEIRQFLIQSNIIILMACKIEQLQDSVKQSIINNYKELINYEKEKINDSPDNKAIKYLEKLFPIAHRLSIPKFQTLFINEEKSNNNFIVKDDENREIINSKSIESGLLKHIYEKYNLFILKSKNPLSTIFPNTLRELSNFIGFLNVNGEIYDLKNYFLIEIKNNLDLTFSSLFNELEDVDITFINQYIINWLGKNHPTVIDLKDGLNPDLKTIMNASNNKNCSFSDVLTVLKSLNSSLLIDNKNNKFIFYLKLYYSIRFRINFDKNEVPIYELSSTLLTNEFSYIFPSQRSGKGRDIFKIHNFNILIDKLKNSNINPESYYWLSFFITHLGDVPPRYRNNEVTFYTIPINNTGSQFKEATFNWFTFLVSSLEPEKIKRRLSPEHLWNSENELFDSLIIWKGNLNKDYYELFNLMFFEEIINIWSKYNYGYKESLGESYEEAMYIYFSENAIKYVFDNLKLKYPYLKINEDILYEHPILKYWREHREEIKMILNEVFNSDQKSNQIESDNFKLNYDQKNIINNFINNVSSRSNKKSTTTNLINNLFDNKIDENTINSIKKLRKSMDSTNRDHNEIVNEIIIILKNRLKING